MAETVFNRNRCGRWLALSALALLCGCDDPRERYTGIYKSQCDNYWGVQIKPAGSGLYSVTFCGLSGCLPPGEWMPNTRIEGDPAYRIVSDDELMIRRHGQEFFRYRRCEKSPEWRTDGAKPSQVSAAAAKKSATLVEGAAQV